MLALFAALLIGGFNVPADVVFGRMLPGTALGVLVGDLIYAWLAARLARRSGRLDVTAVPFGLDTPSSIGMALLVLGPAFSQYRDRGLAPTDAALATWHLGMAATITMGGTKLALALIGRRVQRLVPQAGLLGSLAGIALMLIGFLPLLEIMQEPVAGFLTLGLVLYALLARGRIPLGMPGVLFAVLAGLCAHAALRFWHVAGAGDALPPSLVLRLALPTPSLDVLSGFRDLPQYLPLVLPFALLTVIGGINNTESAKVAGDEYDVRAILLGEAAATLIAGLSGGVAQTTPYIGHSAYKRMGARAGYVLLTGLFIGLGGMLGYVSSLIEFLPVAVLAPIMVFIAVDITAQAFVAVPARHAVAVALSFLPSIARLLTIELSKPEFIAPSRLAQLMSAGSGFHPAGHRCPGQRLHRDRDHLGCLRRGPDRSAPAHRRGISGRRCGPLLLRHHPLGTARRKCICPLAADRARPRTRDPAELGVCGAGGGAAHAVRPARSRAQRAVGTPPAPAQEPRSGLSGRSATHHSAPSKRWHARRPLDAVGDISQARGSLGRFSAFHPQ